MLELGEAVLSKLKVPGAMHLRVAQILVITDQVCVAHLDHEYAELCRVLVARLGRRRPSPLARGDVRIWAAGAIYTVGRVNLLFDRSQDLHVTADELAEHLGVVKSTMANKAALIAKTLDLGMFEPDLTRVAMLERHPMAWIVQVKLVPGRRAHAPGGGPGRGPPARADPRPAVLPGGVTDASHRLVLPGDGVPLCVDGAVTDRLLDLTNHHPAPAPVIEQRPGRYIGYFENAFGEQLVFVHDDGEMEATLYLGDVDWEPRRVSDANGLPEVADLILNREERAFLCACWIATASRREHRRESH